MTLIKRSSALAGRAAAFRADTAPARRGFGDPLAPPPQDDGTGDGIDDTRERYMQLLEARIAELEAALRDGESEREDASADAFRRGHAEGREEGLAAAATREQERVEAVQDAVAKAVSTIDRKIDGERDLAIDIARAALDRILADPAMYHGLVAETARRHAAALQRGTILRLRVSPLDFPDASALEVLPRLSGGAVVEADPSIEAGSCIFDLTLGSLDASIPRQLIAIDEVFEKSYRKAASA